MPIDPRRDAAVTALIVAQDAFQDTMGRSHVIGIFDTIGTSSFPLNAAFVVYCRIQGQGTHTALLMIEDSLEETLVKTEPMVCEVSPTKAHQWFARFGVTFKAQGLYKVKAFLDGVAEIEVPLMVRLAPREQSEGEAAP